MKTKEYPPGDLPSADSLQSSAAETETVGASELKFKGRYLIERELGRGGIGVVYLAKDLQLHGRPVVIKVLLDESGENPWLIKKFHQEVEALCRLDHPGIVQVIDSGETPDGRPFLVMQFIKGRDLRSLMSPEGMDLEEVVFLIRQIGCALTAAHEQKITHCDLKPENIMLQELADGELQVKVVDFGVAKIKDSRVTANTSTKVAGTVPYMAPEQIQGRPTAASDIYAFGVIAYEMITGRRPFTFTSLSPLDVIRAGLKVKPKLLRPELPEAAQEIIIKALSYDPQDRYRRAKDFGELLAQALTAEQQMTAEGAGLLRDASVTLQQPPPPAAIGPDPPSQPLGALEIAHVLSIEIVGYGELPMDQQSRFLSRLLRICPGTPEFRRADQVGEVIAMPTEEGMVLVFSRDPLAPVRCACEVGRNLQSYPELKVRMGIHTGPVYRVSSASATLSAAGEGVKTAQRLVNRGDAGHILVSKALADTLSQVANWANCLHELGEFQLCPGVRVRLFNLYTGEIGNPEVPAGLRGPPCDSGVSQLPDVQKTNSRRSKPYLAGGLILAVIIVGVASYFGLSRALDRRPGIKLTTVEFHDEFFNLKRWNVPPSGWVITQQNRLLIEDQPLVGFPTGVSYRSFKMSFHLRLESAAGAAWALRVKDSNNYYLFYLSGPDGQIRNRFLTYLIRENKFSPSDFQDSIPIIADLSAGGQYQVDIIVENNRFIHRITPADSATEYNLGDYTDPDDTLPIGSIGFRTINREKFSVDDLFVQPLDLPAPN
ncbi:MAG TPA: protein kinase [Blastocatellia bacterium]|nr:protein kinase [Blastocatellia bacterium]